MRPYTSADDAMRHYLIEIEAASSPRGPDLCAIRGRCYVTACLACGSTSWALKGQGQAQICTGVKRNGRRCDRPRDWEPAAVPAGFFDSNARPGATGDRLDHLAMLGAIVRRAGRWPSRLLALYVLQGSYERVQAEGRRRWPRRAEGWSTWTVKQDVKIARQRVETDLARSGWLRGGDLAP